MGAKLGDAWIIVEMVGYAEKWVAKWRDGWISLEMDG
jgi:hypothetical protein